MRGRRIENEYAEYLQLEYQNGAEEVMTEEEWLESESGLDMEQNNFC